MKFPLTFITAFRVLLLSFLCLFSFFSQAIELPQQVQNKLHSIGKSQAEQTLQQGMKRQQMRRNLQRQTPRQMPNRGH
ncbi:hypothetical protein [Pseudoalteromonas gelatinilytica]|uniref:Uncharacterized protein n=1 Tax=Pseudoalteromonas gelatinilytica TaxID=1703256 RepID=A0A3A3EJ36_9GAMM|nr:hypothetical protein [Pseudoalteromonas profundi]RJF35577.1 hypothetical protein D4741_11420 [Pseudoalteromonas profundi]